jgi:alpha-L-fucosidase 2
LNEDTVWSGDKRDRSNPEAPKRVPEIRRLLMEGHPAEAQALADKTMISIPRALPVYETLGDLWLDFGSAGCHPITAASWIWIPASSPCGTRPVVSALCARGLRFRALAATASIVRLTADKPGSISFQATLNRPADATTEAAAGRLIMTGQALPKRASGESTTPAFDFAPR